MTATPNPSAVLWHSGFRPFFAAAGLYGLFATLAWLAFYSGLLVLPLPLAAFVWHGHEMLFGYAVAALAGFLLTATPGWSGTRPVTGRALAALALLWLAGRVVWWLAPWLPWLVVAGIDLLFLPALAGAVLPAIMRAQNKRNRLFIAIFGLFFAANFMVHLEALGIFDDGAAVGLRLALNGFLLLIVMIGGRIIPSFTANALAAAGGRAPKRSEGLDRLAIAAMLLMLVADLFAPQSELSAAMAALAAGVNLLRLIGWRGFAVCNNPILAILHLGYGWLVIGLALKAVVDAGFILPGAVSLHALTIGAIVTMTLAVMSRAALGHSGRALKANGLTLAAYGGVTLAALVRLLVPIADTALYDGSVIVSGLILAAAFLCYSLVYVPICWAPRADGRPG